MPVRLGLRAYGHWRGTEMREAHHALGLDINMRNLILCWDSASVSIVKDREDTAPDYRPYDTRFDVHLCPASMPWCTTPRTTKPGATWTPTPCVLGPIWYECSYVSMCEAYLRHARLEWKRLICRGDDANEIRIETR